MSLFYVIISESNNTQPFKNLIIMQMLNLPRKIKFVLHHPSIIISINPRKKLSEIRSTLYKIDVYETMRFISHMKQNFPYSINSSNTPKLNRLCSLEDWNNEEIRQIFSELHHPPVIIHRKAWEFAMGVLAMKRFNKLNDKCTAIGIGTGIEPIPFYLANKVKHVYATDLYGKTKGWNKEAPHTFLDNPKKYAPFPYKEDALTVLRMDGTKLEFPSETFDIAFSFSSIEHFGGKDHSGALKSMKEIERVLKPGGIAVIATEYIINDKDHPEYFNKKTIYSDLIDKLDSLKLVEPLDLRITTKTLDTVLEWHEALDNSDDEEFAKSHPYLLLNLKNLLFISVMLVFKKQ
ncbi:MAG TPA: class I SAM-dependent methyltransferase [Nitrososphaeraceae archaeon]|nr:class I SAM-dependent methyltransferase [Nitrososphaeraceae archaeon]